MRVQAEKIALEAEIDTWLENNFRDFWPDAIYIPGFMIKTLQGKGGKPDGFIFDPVNRQWFVIENELIRQWWKSNWSKINLKKFAASLDEIRNTMI